VNAEWLGPFKFPILKYPHLYPRLKKNAVIFFISVHQVMQLDALICLFRFFVSCFMIVAHVGPMLFPWQYTTIR